MNKIDLRQLAGWPTRIGAGVLVAAGVAAALVSVPASSPARMAGWTPDSNVLHALEAEDWATVAQALDDQHDQTPPAAPVRFVRAHARLALNHANAAVCDFLGASPDDLVTWRAWTQDYARLEPTSKVATYFSGDALARLGQRDDAEIALSDALERDPHSALAYTARATLYTSTRQWDRALEDFARASAAQPGLAEPYHGRGTTYLLMKSVGPGAVSAFDAALVHASDFAMVLNGRGPARLIVDSVTGAEDGAAIAARAEQDFNAPLQSAACPQVVERVQANLAALSAPHEATDASGTTESGAQANPGFTVKTNTIGGGINGSVNVGVGKIGLNFNAESTKQITTPNSFNINTSTGTFKPTNTNTNIPATSSPAGGAKPDFSDAHVDSGAWWSYVSSFVLAYPTPLP